MPQVTQLSLAGWPEEISDFADLLPGHEFKGYLGEGKTGLALKISDKATGQMFCLKTILPTVKDNVREDVRDTLTKEVHILEKVDHNAIPKVFAHNLSCKTPFYVCTYHPGETFMSFKQSGKRLGREKAIFVIELLIDAFEHLHSVGRSHCDFHHNNVLVCDDVYAHGVLIIDFGSGHRESDSSADTRERGEPRFKPVIAQQRYRENVPRVVANQGFKQADFRAFGHLLGLMADCFFGDASTDQRLAYRSYCESLVSGRIADWESARQEFKSVADPDFLLASAGRLFISADGSRRSRRVPVSIEIPVGEAVEAVLNTRKFQRLQGIKQLSFGDWVYTGGTHTRFEHSLGVFELVLRSLRKLIRRPDFRESHTQLNIEGAILAALVHDIGHYPFAHVIEHYTASRFAGNSQAKELVHHSFYTKELLRSDEELKVEIDRHWGEEVRMEALRILEGKVTVISDLLDGPVDCDKLDYVRRDAYHCGVPFGNGIDVWGITDTLCCVENGEHLGVERSGIAAVEGFMIAQEQMLGEVYWHPRIRAIMAMFHAVVASLVATDLANLARLVNALKRCHNEYQAIRDVILQWNRRFFSKPIPRNTSS